MTKLRHIIADLRYLTIIPKRYKAPQGKQAYYWSKVMTDYGYEQKRIENSDYRWRVITYDDGHKELAFMRVLKGGIFTGAYAAIYRGLLIPYKVSYGTFSHIESIRLAF